MSNPDPAWSLGSDDDFVLEDDDTFGLGEIESGDLPPFDHAETPAPANETAPPPHVEDEDESYGMTAPATIAHAAAAMPIMPREDTRLTEQPVPRVTIHAVCDRHEIADIISGVSADRRMARAEISVETGSIEAAVTRFASQASPNLLILDTLMQGPNMMHALDRLAQVI